MAFEEGSFREGNGPPEETPVFVLNEMGGLLSHGGEVPDCKKNKRGWPVRPGQRGEKAGEVDGE